MALKDPFKALRPFSAGGKSGQIYSVPALEQAGLGKVSRLPVSIRLVLESVLRNCDGVAVTENDVKTLAAWNAAKPVDTEIPFVVARIVLQDFTGVPLLVDLAAMREAVAKLGKDSAVIEPLVPVDLVVDHSVQVDKAGTASSFLDNLRQEFGRNTERYEFLKWGMQAFKTFGVVPPAIGIVHQVNLEYLAKLVFQKDGVFYPDTLVGTDSHTTMINGIGVVGWGVGGIEAEAGMLGQPVYFQTPEVIGVNLTGRLREGVTATDLTLRLTEILRKAKVVGKFVEFFGEGTEALSLADRATIANMAPEYGATMGFFPVDAETLKYLRLSGRSDEQVALVEAYCQAQGLFRTDATPDPVFTDTLELDLSTVVPSLAGPKRPQDRIALTESKSKYTEALAAQHAATGAGTAQSVTYKGSTFDLGDGAVVIAAITSCTNTSNPSVMLAAGLLAKKAVAKGLTTKPWVKTSLAPGSKVATEYFHKADLMGALDALGFNVVGYGCTTCIGNSGPLPTVISEAIDAGKLNVAAVLSGNRNFEGRVNPQTRFNYLASPPLVVAYALAGRMDIDMATEPLGMGTDGPVFLRDIWPSPQEVEHTILESVKREQFTTQYADVFKGDKYWQQIAAPTGDQYAWDGNSTYVKNPPYFEGMTMTPPGIRPITGAKVLGMFGDSITTDHISPAGSIAAASPAGKYLTALGVEKKDFNSYGARRGNHEVMMRGTFANIRLKNELTGGKEGWWTATAPGAEPEAIYDVSMARQAAGVPQIVIAGKEYGTGSSRDWAAKGTMLLGVRAVIAESFERIHRSNLVGMGVLPCEFVNGETRQSLGLTGFETYEIVGLDDSLTPRATLAVQATALDGSVKSFSVRCRIDTPEEMQYYKHGGILPYVLRSLVSR